MARHKQVVIRRRSEVLEPVQVQADPDGCPSVRHRTVDTIGRMPRSATITQAMHDAAGDQAQFTIARFDAIRCMPLARLYGRPAARTGPSWHPQRGRGIKSSQLSGAGSCGAFVRVSAELVRRPSIEARNLDLCHLR